uniref:Uncharacterized protein n=1 Tax=Setaria viridis TaxID=4556 RepID=A0A4U6UZ95_SETVI|nr:hypothetical protein SEVIR_4G108901v2 [Setaria viridis]
MTEYILTYTITLAVSDPSLLLSSSSKIVAPWYVRDPVPTQI